jgi:hypothetical protein
MNRTIVVPRKPTPEQSALLDRTMREHTDCFNMVCREGFETDCRNGIELHKRTYYPLRVLYPNPPAQLVCAIRVRAIEAIKLALMWRRKHADRYLKLAFSPRKRDKEPSRCKPMPCPQSTSTPIRDDQRSSWVKWDTLTCSLATVSDRGEIPFNVPRHAQAEAMGMQVVKIDPRHTSQTCSRCGHELNADFNAAITIREKHLASPAQDGTSILIGLAYQATFRLDASASGTSPRLQV